MALGDAAGRRDEAPGWAGRLGHRRVPFMQINSEEPTPSENKH
jgi:hypothetical protein